MLITTKRLGGTDICKNHCNIKRSKDEQLALQRLYKIEHLYNQKLYFLQLALNVFSILLLRNILENSQYIKEICQIY